MRLVHLLRNAGSGSAFRTFIFVSIAATMLMISTEASFAKTCTFNPMPALPDVALDIVVSRTYSSSESTTNVTMNCETALISLATKACILLDTDQAPISSKTDMGETIFFLSKAGSTANNASRLAIKVMVDGVALGRKEGSFMGKTAATVAEGFPVQIAIGWVRQKISFGKIGFQVVPRESQDLVSEGTYTGSFRIYGQYGGYFMRDDCSNGSLITSEYFTITARVQKTCQFENMKNIDFGTIELSQAQASATGNIGVRCTYQTPYKISIGSGKNPTDTGIRRMANNGNLLPYELFQQDCKTPWTANSTLSGQGTRVNDLNNHSVCAKLSLPKTGGVMPGAYADEVITTIEF
ncbi:spore coat protein U domain-containing protein [Phyllobacterium sp. 628]|uniref:Csu type fimbrial protein n=1 Tax=Phyllobacterium sp. 628 TaxID=2718938 RepID=UPI001662751F|nr:spore coat U domain-containing protein [Phyllobacterium sp. 628]QND52801.1 spore coat protein U domain-containing protein [Phyllobacterium sp. 628]